MSNKKQQDTVEDFNDLEWFMENVRPLVQKIHSLCSERNIPFISAFAYGLEQQENAEVRESRYSMGGYCYLPGNDRTPPEMHYAHDVLFKGFDEAAPHFARHLVEAALGLRNSKTERGDAPPTTTTIQ